MLPPAPGLLSTTTVWPQAGLIFSEIVRARMSGAPPVDYFIRDAGARLAHVHLQDVDGHADRHWPPGEGEIEWHAVFRALADAPGAPHLLLELRDKAAIPRGFAWLRDLELAC